MDQDKIVLEKYIKNNFKNYYPNLNYADIVININRERSIIPHKFSCKRYHCIINGKDRDKNNFDKHIFVKKVPGELFLQEVKNLETLKNYSIESQLIPKFFDFLSKENILIWEYIYPRQNLLIDFLKSPSSNVKKEKIRKIIKKVAIWLCDFQKKCILEEKSSVDQYIKKAEKELGIISYFSDKQKGKIVKKIKKDLKNIKTLPLVFSSNDFTLRNILITNSGKIIVVDWSHLLKTYNYWDLHSFIINLESRTRHRGVFNKGYIKDLKNIFLKTYENNSIFQFSENVYYLTRKLYIIYYLYNYYQKYNHKKITLKKFIFWKNFINNLKQELIDYIGD